MAKKVLIAILAVILVLGLASCSDKSSSGGGSSDPTRPATLELRNFKDNYKKGDTQDKITGTLLYTSSEGKITTVDVKDSGVTVSGFDTSAEASGKIVKFTYKGLDCVGTYSVFDIPAVLDVAGCFVVDDLTTYEFSSKSNKVEIQEYTCWDQYENFTGEMAEPTYANYTVEVSSNGLTYALVNGKRFYPDGKGEFEKYESGYLASPKIFYGFYVSDDKESNSEYTGPTDTKARGKYLVVNFTNNCEMQMWFEEIKPTNTLPTRTADYTVPASDIKFGTMGVFIKNATIGNTKNLSMISKNDFKESISITSSSEGEYRGYFYRLTYVETEY